LQSGSGTGRIARHPNEGQDNMNPVIGQTIVGFSGDEFIFLAFNDDGDIIVRDPVTLKLMTFPTFMFDCR
jgi:hypothetical protein